MRVALALALTPSPEPKTKPTNPSPQTLTLSRRGQRRVSRADVSRRLGRRARARRRRRRRRRRRECGRRVREPPCAAARHAEKALSWRSLGYLAIPPPSPLPGSPDLQSLLGHAHTPAVVVVAPGSSTLVAHGVRLTTHDSPRFTRRSRSTATSCCAPSGYSCAPSSCYALDTTATTRDRSL